MQRSGDRMHHKQAQSFTYYTTALSFFTLQEICVLYNLSIRPYLTLKIPYMTYVFNTVQHLASKRERHA